MKICLLHDVGWAGQDVEYSICEVCKAESQWIQDHATIDGFTIKEIMEREV